MALLETRDLWVERRGPGPRQPQAVLRAIDLAIVRGRVTALLGETGAGKTMLAKALAGLLPGGFAVSRGSVAFHGARLRTDADWRGIRGRRIFYAPQNAAASLNPTMTIGRQINECSRIDAVRLLEMMAALHFARPQRILASYPFMLSGGENQRCLLAMALACLPELLILDEPTAELDAGAQADSLRVLLDCQRRHELTVLLISHHLDLVTACAQNLYVISAGMIVAAGTPATVLSAPGHPYVREIAAYLGYC
jgi:ABC-type glutathione transport system ATPase component